MLYFFFRFLFHGARIPHRNQALYYNTMLKNVYPSRHYHDGRYLIDSTNAVIFFLKKELCLFRGCIFETDLHSTLEVNHTPKRLTVKDRLLYV